MSFSYRVTFDTKLTTRNIVEASVTEYAMVQ